MTLLDQFGKPMQFAKKKPPTALGEAFGPWAGDHRSVLSLPGGGAIQFDLSRLTLSDFRQMKSHYQVEASLAVLTFMLHQLEWKILCDDKKVASHVEENLSQIWTRLVRAKSQAFWAGYSPNVLQWENDAQGKTVQLTKIKDLLPEEARVHWKHVDGWAPPGYAKPRVPVYDGIRYNTYINGWRGGGWPIPVENTYWYPLLMENGDYYGRKLLRSAYIPWFFSNLMHLFANRYFERFGEPVPVGRAPFDDTVNVNGKEIPGNDVMGGILTQLRNRSAVVLPNNRTLLGTSDATYDYEIEYLESQMRGADFERYMTRLDEEISLALFTPLLMLRTADVGSYNLGVTHAQVYMWMINAIAGDWSEYIDKYILSPMVDFNFSEKAPRPHIRFRKLGRENTDLVRDVVAGLISADKAKPDLEELGQMAGLDLKEVRQLTDPSADPNADPSSTGDPNVDPSKDGTGSGAGGAGGASGGGAKPKPKTVAKDVTARVAAQAEKAFKQSAFDAFEPDLGYKRVMVLALSHTGVSNASDEVDALYSRVNGWVREVAEEGVYSSAAEFSEAFGRLFDNQVGELIGDRS